MLNEFITENPAHVYCIQETKFGPHHNYFFASYTTLLVSTCGGAMLLVHSDLKMRNSGMVTGEIDCAHVDVFIDDKWITIGSIYYHPLCGSLDFLTRLANRGPHLLIGGDFNARDVTYGDYSGNRLGTLIVDWPLPLVYESIRP